MLPYQPRANEVPVETARFARASFPKGNPYLKMRDEMGVIFADGEFAGLFHRRGRPGESPGMLAMVCILQHMEGLSDRQAADAVRGRMDWKYALGLELDDTGFEYTVLRDFRHRLLAGGAEEKLLNCLLTLFQERELLKNRGTQRTDSTHLLAAVREVNRLELVGETVRAALNQLATEAGEWLMGVVTRDWGERYGARVEAYRLPQTKKERQELGIAIGEDGMLLLEAIYHDETPTRLSQLPMVAVLRQVWVQQFYVENGQVKWRQPDSQPPGAQLIQSPYDPEARYSRKRQTTWTGYKVHLTETCDPQLPTLVTHVETTPATQPDNMVLDTIHTALAAKALLPETHLVDGGYMDAGNLVSAGADYTVDLLGPVAADTSWQARTNGAYDLTCFQVDWQAQQVACPSGKTSSVWSESHDAYANALIHVRFEAQDCRACSDRTQCTRSAAGPRSLKLRSQPQYHALQQGRQRQHTPEYQQAYARRAGIEGTISQATRSFSLRQCRYIGQAKTHLQNIFTACALNLSRVIAFWKQRPIAHTRTSSFLTLVTAND